LISDEVIEDIKNRVDIAEVIGEYVHLTRKGDRYWGLSPFKTEKTPSFTVTPSRQMYYCFSTQKGGNVFSFIMEMEGMTFPEAVEYLGKKVGIQVQGDQQVDDRAYKERAALHELYDKVQKAFHFLLTSKDIGRHALEYIRNRDSATKSSSAFLWDIPIPNHSGCMTSWLRKGILRISWRNQGCSAVRIPAGVCFQIG
jgi:DNA primase